MTVHIVTPPRQVPQSACWFAECSCGGTVIDETRDGAAQQMQPHRDAQQRRHSAGSAPNPPAPEERC